MRLVQLTDVHLRHHLPGSSALNTRRSREMVGLLEEALRRVRREDADLLAITGDLLDAPGWLYEDTYGFQRDDPAPWLEAAEKDYGLLKKMFDGSGLRYTSCRETTTVSRSCGVSSIQARTFWKSPGIASFAFAIASMPGMFLADSSMSGGDWMRF